MQASLEARADSDGLPVSQPKADSLPPSTSLRPSSSGLPERPQGRRRSGSGLQTNHFPTQRSRSPCRISPDRRCPGLSVAVQMSNCTPTAEMSPRIGTPSGPSLSVGGPTSPCSGGYAGALLRRIVNRLLCGGEGRLSAAFSSEECTQRCRPSHLSPSPLGLHYGPIPLPSGACTCFCMQTVFSSSTLRPPCRSETGLSLPCGKKALGFPSDPSVSVPAFQWWRLSPVSE
mmetsp:Transcript_43700/g.86197  ORF Transcript_43700/g.86197 Transcript_43700/m.86197 type:complete len:230 (+) Transcript_43700:92-781(+)